MKKFLVLFVAVTIIFSCSNEKGWSNKDRSDFIKSCADGLKGSFTDSKAKDYCECMQPKVETKYPTASKASNLSAADFQSEEWMGEARKCLGMENINNNNNGGLSDPSDDNTNSGSGWSETDRASWASTCAESLSKQNWSEQAKKNYCDCVRDRLEKKYSTFNEMNTKGTYEDGVEFGKQCAGALTGGDN